MGVVRKQITRPVPPNAEKVLHQGKPAIRYQGRDGKPVVGILNAAGDRMLVLSKKWYGRVPGGKPVPLSSNKAAAEMILGEMIRAHEMRRANAVDPYAAHRKRPLANHLEDYLAEVKGRASPKHHRLTRTRLAAIIDGCGWERLQDLDASAAARWLREQREGGEAPVLPAGKEEWTAGELRALLGCHQHAVNDAVRRRGLAATGQGKARRYPRATVEALAARRAEGMSTQTANHYTTALKALGNWLAGEEVDRVPKNPFARLKAINALPDQRHARRALTDAELARLLETTRASGKVLRGLSGPDRHALYATACGTGFRAEGLASLTPECFRLGDSGGKAATVRLPVRADKSKRGKVQPVAAELAGLLRSWLDGKPTGRRVWPGSWYEQAAEMLRSDLAAAGIAPVTPGPDGPEHADFHALRHSYLTILGLKGVDLRTLQELAGHSTPLLTMRYCHRTTADLSRAVEKTGSPGLSVARELSE